MSQTLGTGSRTRRLGAAVTAVALVTVAAPSLAHAQSSSDADPAADTGTSSVDDLTGLLPEEIMVGGDGFGSEGLRESGSGEVADGAQSTGQVLGSAAPLEMVGVSGGSAAASVASSGSLPGSVYANPTGSLGSGTIGLGSLAIPEYIFPVLSVQFAGGFFAALGERQEAGELYPHELDFWHGVVEGSAEGGTMLTDAATDAGTELPGGLTGSIEKVQLAALEDPYEANERRRAEAEAAAEAEERGETADTDTVTDTDADADAVATDGDAPEEMNDDDETRESPAGATDPGEDTRGGTGGDVPAQDAAVTPSAPVHTAGAAQAAPAVTAAPATLATTGVETTAVAGLAAVSLLLGSALLIAARRRA